MVRRRAQRGGEEPVSAGQIAVVLHVEPSTSRLEYRGSGGALPVGMLYHDGAAGAQQPRRDVFDDADRVEPVGPRPQRRRRVVRSDLGVADLGAHRDVRRVADDDVDRTAQIGAAGRHVAEAQFDVSAQAVDASPLVRHRVGLDGVHASIGDLVGDRHGNRSGTGAEVDDDRWVR